MVDLKKVLEKKLQDLEAQEPCGGSCSPCCFDRAHWIGEMAMLREVLSLLR